MTTIALTKIWNPNKVHYPFTGEFLISFFVFSIEKWQSRTLSQARKNDYLTASPSPFPCIKITRNVATFFTAECQHHTQNCKSGGKNSNNLCGNMIEMVENSNFSVISICF
jgi:hypothetical protein